MGSPNVTGGGVGGWAGTRRGPQTGDDKRTGGGGEGAGGGGERMGGWGDSNVFKSFSASLSQ